MGGECKGTTILGEKKKKDPNTIRVNYQKMPGGKSKESQ